MIQYHQLRDCQAWKEDGLELSTTSNEAAKLYDLALHQNVGWYESKEYGGLEGTLKALHQADPNFFLGKIFILEGEFLGVGSTIKEDKTSAEKLELLKKEAENNTNISEWERMHVEALDNWANGRMSQASRVWERILLDYPQDILALKMAQDTYFYMGKFGSLRDSVARVMPEYRPTSSYYGYLRGMYAFGLEETNYYREAEKNALKALELNKNDIWASHALTHVYEMEGKVKEGLKFVSSTQEDWKVCNTLSGHMNWHWCLLLMEEGRYDEILELYDTVIHKRVCHNKSMLDMMDSTSLLYRLQLEGVNVEGRWEDVYEICRPHLNNHMATFNDVHILMGICGMKNLKVADEHLASLINYADTADTDNAGTARWIGVDLCKAVKAYSWGEYSEATELLWPIKEDLIKMGGSAAQRDIFNQILIHAALKSTNPNHWKIAKSLLYERKAFQPDSPLTNRLMAKLLSCHVASNSH